MRARQEGPRRSQSEPASKRLVEEQEVCPGPIGHGALSTTRISQSPRPRLTVSLTRLPSGSSGSEANVYMFIAALRSLPRLRGRRQMERRMGGQRGVPCSSQQQSEGEGGGLDGPTSNLRWMPRSCPSEHAAMGTLAQIWARPAASQGIQPQREGVEEGGGVVARSPGHARRGLTHRSVLQTSAPRPTTSAPTMAGPASAAELAAGPFGAFGRERWAEAGCDAEERRAEDRERGEEAVLVVAGRTDWTNPMATNLGTTEALHGSAWMPEMSTRPPERTTHPRM
jgi:hypothetical protein